MPRRIVTINVTQTSAPTPNNLQQMGAVLSQGATTLSTGSSSMLAADSSLTALLAAPLQLSGLVWSAGTVTATTVAAIPGLSAGDTFITAVAGATPTGYNGTYDATVTGANTFTFALASNPGTETAAGTYTPPNQQELIAMVDEFYSQGQSQAVYVLELGAGDGATGPTALSTWIEDHPGVFYSYLVPRSWDGEENFITLVKQYTNDNSMTYFFVTTTTENFDLYTEDGAAYKSVFPFVEAPNANVSLDSFDCASPFQMWLYGTVNGPVSAGNQMGPFANRYSYGTTAWQESGNTATLNTLDNASVNYIYTGAEGGIATNILENGCFADGNAMEYWWALDWLQITINQTISNAIINAANNGASIDYDQAGIDTLQDDGYAILGTGVAYNLLNGPVQRSDLTQAVFVQDFNDGDYNGTNTINAVPFASYVAIDPTAYKARQYGGFSVVATPMLGIESVIFNVNAVTFA